jgi:predicted anti-sigma-YlaC factor YlaD
MKQHYSEADLLETYYTQPGESMPVMMHLADCSECAARYERLDRKLRSLAACEHDKPETFWARQRIAVMRKIDAQRSRSSLVSRTTRIAAAAALVLVLGGGIYTMRDGSESQSLRVSEEVTQTAALDTATGQLDNLTTDPWQSDELKDFQSVVAWESWVESETGDKSL